MARQILRRVLAAPIAVRPTGKGTWAFAGFSKYDEVLAGGVAKRVAVSELRDAGTANAMLGYIKQVLDAAGVKDARVVLRERDSVSWTVEGPGAEVVAKQIMADAGHPDWFDGRPISGGSDVDPVGSRVSASEMAPTPPRARRAPA